MHDPLQKPRQHQPHRRFGINPGPTETVGIKIGNLTRKPRQIQNSVHPNQRVIVRKQIAQRSADEKLQLIPFLPTQHRNPQVP